MARSAYGSKLIPPRQARFRFSPTVVSGTVTVADLTELFQNPSCGAQNTLDNYGGYAKAGMVVYAQSSLK